MNCGLCIAYLREENKCCGCMKKGDNKPEHCKKCRIKFCEEHDKTDFLYCYECTKFPCAKLKNLNQRYTEKYNLSLIDNLKTIKQSKINDFMRNENIKWKCPTCGEILCVHRNACLKCGATYR